MYFKRVELWNEFVKDFFTNKNSLGYNIWKNYFVSRFDTCKVQSTQKKLSTSEAILMKLLFCEYM